MAAVVSPVSWKLIRLDFPSSLEILTGVHSTWVRVTAPGISNFSSLLLFAWLTTWKKLQFKVIMNEQDLSQYSASDVLVLALSLKSHVRLSKLVGNFFQGGRDGADHGHNIGFARITIDANIADHRAALQDRLHFAKRNIPYSDRLRYHWWEGIKRLTLQIEASPSPSFCR